MRIIELARNFSYNDGISRVIFELSKKLKKKHDVEVIYNYSSGEPIKFPSKQLGQLETINYVSKNADIVHTHFGLSLAFADMSKKINSNLKHVYTYHVNPPREVTGSSWFDYKKINMGIYLGVKGGVDKVVAISKYAKIDFLEKYGKPEPIVIYNGVDTEKFVPNKKSGRSFREKHNISSDCFLLGYLARFSFQKNHPFLIRLAKELPKDIKIVLAGNPNTGAKSTYNYCKELIKSLNLEEKIIVLENIPENEITDFYNSLDVYVIPSLWEGFGLPILEAMSCEKPVVSLNSYVYPELVGGDKKNGFTAKNINEFKKQVLKLYSDSKLYKETSKNAIKFAKTMDWEKKAEEYSKMMKKLVE
ncbi:Trehalose synthase [uncultured archaeon]|nr:Trehalose synthase [uncultured archaeon]